LSIVAFLPVTSLFAQQDAPLPELPVLEAYYPLSSNALNQVGNGATNNGVVMGAVFQDSALVFDGTESYVNFGSSVGGTSSLSVCVWLKPDRDDKLLRVLGKFQTEDNNKEYCLFLNNGNVFAFFSDNGKAEEPHAFLKTTILPAVSTQTWHHLAATWDSVQGGSSGLHFYVDGKECAAADVQTSEIHARHSSTVDLTLGAYDVLLGRDGAPLATRREWSPSAALDGASALPTENDQPAPLVNPFQGSLSQLMLFSGVLSSAEVHDLYEQGRLGNLMPYLSAYWPDAPTGSGATPLPPDPARRGTSSRNLEPSVAHIIYVDHNLGDDTFKGEHRLVADRAAKRGPKRTIKAGLTAAGRDGTVIVAEGLYVERVVIDGIRVIMPGNVVIREPR
jgi:hypothetical protein